MEIYSALDKLLRNLRYLILRLHRIAHLLICYWIKIRSQQVEYRKIITLDKSVSELITESDICFADKVLLNIIWIFNRELDMGDAIKWDTDYNSGFAWPKGKYITKYQQVNIQNDADVKYPREISRCHQFLLLGQAYFKTSDKKYYTKFKTDILSWIIENPFMYSINWGCTQDVAIRSVNWIWAFFFFEKEIDVDKDFKQLLKKSLYQHGHYIYWYPENNGRCNSNHYLGDLVGQIYCGLFFDDKYANQWLKRGIEEFYREIRFEFLPSGPSFEKSTNYNRLVMEFVFSTVALLKNNGFEIPQDIVFRMNKMLDFTLAYLKPNGIAPVIGDQDDARLHPFTIQSNLDHQYLLSFGYYLLKRNDLACYSKLAKKENAIMKLKTIQNDVELITNKENHIDYSAIITKKQLVNFQDNSSDSFPDAGFYIIRHKADYMFINCSGKGKYPDVYSGTHTHSDLLSIELYIDDKTFLVDPGSFVYSADPEQRMIFRSTYMHNTMVVDNHNQNELHKEVLWDFGWEAIPTVIKWLEDKDRVLFLGEHNGYSRLSEPVIHQRSIEYDKRDRTWIIIDKALGNGTHTFALFFHFDTLIPISIINNSVYTDCLTGTNISLEFESKTDINLSIIDGFVSKAYGNKLPAKILVINACAACPFEIITLIKRR